MMMGARETHAHSDHRIKSLTPCLPLCEVLKCTLGELLEYVREGDEAERNEENISNQDDSFD